ncbi:DUF2157 domain-containing protein [Emticicia sp. BO119]|uniref:DUF2157 domain-containing protein n=1 Tax=Emticicia sp. BO119 TaxID=2757768 RepID=UPI0015F0C28B|nr:DUF2157 domain-containing protein [Emticicia sp. BO119]MBA4849156.1 DUF2157 domain-containing protein [Emticicia sp. BO119]
MNYTKLLKTLVKKEIIPEEQSEKIAAYEQSKPFSIHWELRTLLYVGITLLGSGLGVVIYENIDSIGHNVLIGLIVAAFLGCLYYAFKHRKPFTWEEVIETEKLDDFALLGACVMFLTLEGYLQYQYNIFGTRYGLAAFLPAVLFFFLAYRLDHRGVLSMAITAFGSWVGVNIAPIKLWQQKNFSTADITHISILLGVVLIVMGGVSEYKSWKKHFSFTYFLFGFNIAFVAILAGLFQFEMKLIYLLIMAVLSYGSIWYARKTQSYLFLLMGVIYGYIALTYWIFHWEYTNAMDFTLYMLYFMSSAVGVVFFLINIKQIIGLKK